MKMDRTRILLACTLFAFEVHLQRAYGAPAEDAGELFLTPLIKSGDLTKAREVAMDSMKLSKVQSEKDVTSYSGFLTIDESTHSNLFFWFFPAEINPADASVILWVNDIPGYTCLKGVFLETGPFSLDENNKLKDRNSSWARTHSMLYIDAPVGTGFSFADSEDSYANNSEDVASEVYEALTQFFTLFKELQPNDLYLGGELFAGSFMLHIAQKIDKENEKRSEKIKLKGLIMGSPYLDKEQIRGVDYHHSLGLISREEKIELEEAIQKAFDLHKEGKEEEAIGHLASLILGPESSLARFTGFGDTYSALTSKGHPEGFARFIKFIESKEAHNYLHAGLHKFIAESNVVYQHFGLDLFNKHTGIMEKLLEKGYRALVFVGQFDIFLTHDGVEEVVSQLKWSKAGEFAQAPRKIWRVNDEVAGYARSIGSFAYVLVRNAGAYAIQDQPEWTTDLVEKFISGKDF